MERAARRRQAPPRLARPRRSPGSRISNPERRNALDHEILDAIAETLPRLDRGIETRCVADHRRAAASSPPATTSPAIPSETFERDAEALVAHPFHAAMEAIAAHPWPTVAAINGHCLGGGLELAITCDLRICAAGAKLGMPPAKLGLIYGHTGLRKFLDTVGLPRTKELFLTGRNLDAARAEQIGLVNEVVADEELEDAAVPAVKEFSFEVGLVARVHVRAPDEASARQAVPRVMGAPGTKEIALANQGIDFLLPGAMVTAVDFIPRVGSKARLRR